MIGIFFLLIDQQHQSIGRPLDKIQSNGFAFGKIQFENIVFCLSERQKKAKS